MKRYLGVDPGQRRVGLAVSDEAGVIPTPLRIVDREEESLGKVLAEVIEDKNITEIIVGYPTPLKTDENERTRQVDNFIEQFIEPLSIPHRTISERYSTREAERLREERDDRGEPGDDEAAAMILEYFLERHRDLGSAPNEGNERR
jgi:putative Holliday junction resolvase